MNACDDFFNMVFTSYVLIACMQMLGMDLSNGHTKINVEEFGFSTDSWMKLDYFRRSESRARELLVSLKNLIYSIYI